MKLEVEDQGYRMAPDVAAKAFDRGYQGDAGMVRGDGAGLGLSIVKELAERNGSTAFPRSEFGVGTVPTITLPCTN